MTFEQYGTAELPRAIKVNERMNEVIRNPLTIAREGVPINETESPEVDKVVRQAW